MTSYREDLYSNPVSASTTQADQLPSPNSDCIFASNRTKSRRPAYSLGHGIFIDGRRWFSRAEYASAIMMERFVEGFKTIRGVTYQVPIASSERGTIIPVDFILRLSGYHPIVLEFHVPRDWRRDNRVGDFRSIDDYKENRALAKALSQRGRQDEIRQFQKQTRDQLVNNYSQKLRARIDQNRDYVGAELIVVTSGYEFYRKVIRRFGQDFPSEGPLVANFNKLARIRQRDDWRTRQCKAA